MMLRMGARRRAQSEGRSTRQVQEQEMIRFRRELYRSGLRVRNVQDGAEVNIELKTGIEKLAETNLLQGRGADRAAEKPVLIKPKIEGDQGTERERLSPEVGQGLITGEGHRLQNIEFDPVPKVQASEAQAAIGTMSITNTEVIDQEAHLVPDLELLL
eukprot:g46543.t1